MLRLATKGQKSRKIGITPGANGLRCQLALKHPTYTEIYGRIAADAPSGSTSRCAMWKTICNNSMAVTVVAIWFTVVTLGFGSHVWPLLGACGKQHVERHWHQRGGRHHERDLDHRGCLADWRPLWPGLPAL